MIEFVDFRVWLCNKVAKRFSEARQYGAAFALRQRMLSCLQNLQYYMCVEVMEPNWCAFTNSLNKVSKFVSHFNDSTLK